MTQPQPILPLGPICTFGQRLAYTYFHSTTTTTTTNSTTSSSSTSTPTPTPESLNLKYSKVILGGSTNASSNNITGGEGGTHWFTIDDQLLYLSFFQDSGPLNAACLYRFCLHVHTLLEDPELKSKRIVLYSSDEPDKKANSALLMALYAMIVMRWSPSDVLHPIAILELQPFRDAGYARADYHLSVQSVIYGTHRAISLHLLDLATFDLLSYETYEKVENGDWNWITPGFVAFASPVEPSFVAVSTAGGGGGRGGMMKVEGAKPRLSKAFRNVLEEFQRGGVRVVVRLNKKLYDSNHFTERGIDHVEMYFDDGTNPPMEMTRTFIELSDKIISSGGTVAVHCKAGLGRTGTLIGAYLIYKHGFTASEAIAFMRLMRPGSCVGPQQHFLYENQMTWIRWAAVDKFKASLPPSIPLIQQQVQQTSIPIIGSIIGESSSSASNIRLAVDPRPLTPPNEIDLISSNSSKPQSSRSRHTTPIHSLDVPPRTPGRTVQVPGQPRKTPGKSKHSVASPEVRDLELDLGLGRATAVSAGKGKEEDMMLIHEEGDEEEGEGEEEEGPRTPTASTSNLNQPKFGSAVNSRNLSSPTKAKEKGSPPSISTDTTTTTTSNTSTNIISVGSTNGGNNSRPTRIATRTRATRPLSAITDNRIVDRLGTTTTHESTSSEFKNTSTTKAVRDLVTVFESNSNRVGSATITTSTTEGGGEISSGRYDLRNGRTSPSDLPPSSTSNIPGMGQSSPSRLPQRIPAKRRGAGITDKSTHLNNNSDVTPGGKSCAMEIGVGTGGLGGVGRSVRRRRSSLGSTDFVVQGPGEL